MMAVWILARAAARVQLTEPSSVLGQEVEARAPCRSRHKVLTLVDCSTGQAKSAVVKDPGVFTLIPILRANIAREATVFTDEARWHKDLSRDFEVGCAP